MKHVESYNLHSIVLNELEWYLAPPEQQAQYITDCTAEAIKRGVRYANIWVETDATMSISPVEGKHYVWRHTFASDEETDCRADILAAIESAQTRLGAVRGYHIAKEVLESLAAVPVLDTVASII